MTVVNQSEGSNNRSSDALSFVRMIFAIYGFALVLMAGFYIKKFGFSLSAEHDHWGQFGDFFGGILNPLASFFTLLVAVLVWNLQKKELSATRALLNTQLDANQQQRYEQVFLDLLKRAETLLQELAQAQQFSVALQVVSDSINKIQETGQGFGFNAVYYAKSTNDIDTKIKPVSNFLRQWIGLHYSALDLLHKKIADKSLWQDIYRSNIGQDQITLLCMIACSSEHENLRLAISRCKVYDGLSKPELAFANTEGWFPHFDKTDVIPHAD